MDKRAHRAWPRRKGSGVGDVTGDLVDDWLHRDINRRRSGDLEDKIAAKVVIAVQVEPVLSRGGQFTDVLRAVRKPPVAGGLESIGRGDARRKRGFDGAGLEAGIRLPAEE